MRISKWEEVRNGPGMWADLQKCACVDSSVQGRREPRETGDGTSQRKWCWPALVENNINYLVSLSRGCLNY